MALTDSQLQTLIQTECNPLALTTINSNVTLYWQMYDGYGQQAQYWYGRLHALQATLASLVLDVDIQNGTDRQARSQQFKQVVTMMNICEKMIAKVDPVGSATDTFASITATSNNYENIDVLMQMGYEYYGCEGEPLK